MDNASERGLFLFGLQAHLEVEALAQLKKVQSLMHQFQIAYITATLQQYSLRVIKS